MRESLRGALLSVLFFALLIGGAPGMAGAVGTGGGSSEGNTGLLDVSCPPGSPHPYGNMANVGCEAYNDMSDLAQCATVIGGLTAASFALAAIAAAIETKGATAALMIRYSKAIAAMARATAAVIAAGCMWALG